MQLNRDKIQRMIVGRVAGSGGGGGSDFDPTGLASELWVEENYISKAFFNRIFEIYGPGEHSGDPDVQVEPNDTDTTISNIKALVGFWTEEYVSALGQNSEQGGGGITLNEPLASINNASLGTPSNGQTLVYRNNQWTYGTGGGSGSVTSITAGTGLSGGTITTSGTIAISSTYQTYISHGESAYNALDNYLLKTAGVTAIVVGSGTNADKIGVTINGSNSGWITVPFATKATTADKLSVVSKTAWGQTYWTSGGVPDSIDGNMTNVGDISFKASGKKIGGFLFFDTTNTRLGVNQASPAYLFDVNGNSRLDGLVGIATAPSSSYKLNVGGYTKTTRLYLTDSVYLEYDSSNSGIHLVGAGFYADTYVSALGSNSGGGGGASDYIPLSGSTAITGNLTPSRNNSCSLGSSSKQWANVYCTSLKAYGASSIAGSLMLAGSITPTSDQQYSLGTESLRFAGLFVHGRIYLSGMNIQYLSGGSGVLSGYHFQAGSSDIILETSGYVWQRTTSQYYSDMRKKNVLSYIDVTVESIAKAPVFNFIWNDLVGGNIQQGSSAQYWRDILPNGVAEASNGTLGMDYATTALISAVITARRVVNHEARIRLLEVENQALRNEINQLKKMV